MTKKHFEIIAGVIAHHVRCDRDEKGAVWTAELLAEDLAHEFAKLNPLFDTDRFLAACGINKGNN
jgi:hypothetical protein